MLNWLKLARAYLAIETEKYGEKNTFARNAGSAAYIAYTRTKAPAQQAAALAVLAESLAARQQWRPALRLYKASLALAPNADVQQAYDEAFNEHGFRMLDYTSDNELNSPRICVQFSETLAKGRIDFANFVTVNNEKPASVRVQGTQLCIEGLQHGKRYEVKIRSGVPSVEDDLSPIAHQDVHLLARKTHHQNRIRRRHAHAHDGARQRRNAEPRIGEKQKPHNAGQRRRQCRDNQEWIEPRLEVDHDQQVHQQDRKGQPGLRSKIETLHSVALATQSEAGTARQILLVTGDNLLHRARSSPVEKIVARHQKDLQHGSRFTLRGQSDAYGEVLFWTADRAASRTVVVPTDLRLSVFDPFLIISALLRHWPALCGFCFSPIRGSAFHAGSCAWAYTSILVVSFARETTWWAIGERPSSYRGNAAADFHLVALAVCSPSMKLRALYANERGLSLLTVTKFAKSMRPLARVSENYTQMRGGFNLLSEV